MTNLVANLYEDSRGRFFKLIETDQEFLEYCEEQDNEDTHEQIQKIYEKLEFIECLDTPTKIYELKLRRI